MGEYLSVTFGEKAQAKGNRKEGGEGGTEAYEGEINWRLIKFTVKNYVVCNSGHVLLGDQIKEYENFRGACKHREKRSGCRV